MRISSTTRQARSSIASAYGLIWTSSLPRADVVSRVARMFFRVTPDHFV